jgi:hypothetical protein
MNCSIPIGVEKAEWRDGEMQSTPAGTAVARLGALADLELDHLHLRRLRLLREPFLAEAAVRVAAAEVAAADFPDQVAAVLAMVAADAALAGVMREAALLRADIERADGVRRQRAEAHRRDAEHRVRVRLRAAALAHHHAEIRVLDLQRVHRVVDPLVVRRVGIDQRAVGALVNHVLGALVHQRTLRARERDLLGLRLEEVLADLGPDELQEETQVRQDRVVAADRLPRLQHVPGAEQAERARHQHHRQQPGLPGHRRRAGEEGQHAAGKEPEPRRHPVSQLHGHPLATAHYGPSSRGARFLTREARSE